MVDLMLSHPPPNRCSILMHHTHGVGIKPNADAAWANREEHYIWAPRGYSGPDASVEDREATAKWSDDMYAAGVALGLKMDKGYWSYMRPEHCDAVVFYGEQSVKRLRRLKEKYNMSGAFPQAYPVLGEALS
jgi:hypothetical protein